MVHGGTRANRWLHSTRLYFGSAVVRLDLLFNALLGFHKLYSRLLLHAAHSRLTRSTRG